MLPFLVLLVPQFIRNWGFLLSGNPQALASLSWLGYVTGLGGNTLLLSYFTAKRETSAVCVQAVGIASAFAVLTQMRVALCIPRAIYLGVAIVVGATTILTGLKLSGCLEGSKAGQHLWTVWQKALGLTGLFAVPQVLCATFSVDIWIPTAVITAAGCILAAGEALGAPLPPSLRNAWGSLSAWTATLLFMLQPVAQLLRNFTAPAGLESLSVATVAFAALGNALMVPRALWTGDTVWLVGSSWGALVFGWCQLFSLYLGTTASGQRILGHAPFMAATVILWGWLIGTSAYSITLRGKQARRGAQ